MLELVSRGWAELTAAERAVFDDWAKSAQGADLYLLLRHARRAWTRGPRTSSSQTFAAITETAAPPAPGEET